MSNDSENGNVLSDEEADRQLAALLDEFFDPGCEKATRFHDKLAEFELRPHHQAALNALAIHKRHTHEHSPNCFVNRVTH